MISLFYCLSGLSMTVFPLFILALVFAKIVTRKVPVTLIVALALINVLLIVFLSTVRLTF